MNKFTLQAALVVISTLLVFTMIVGALHWHHGHLEMDHRGDALPIDDLG